MSESILSELFPALSLEDMEAQEVTLKKGEQELTLEGTSGSLKKPSMTVSESIISELFPALSLEDKEEQEVTLKKGEQEVTLKKRSMTVLGLRREWLKKNKEKRKKSEWMKKFVGVRFCMGAYQAIIRTPADVRGYRRRIWLGTYSSPEDAALVYDGAAYVFYGSEATFNFPEKIRTRMAEPNPTSFSPDDGQNK